MKPSNNFNAENAITLLVGPEQQKLVVHVGYIRPQRSSPLP
jgi:hypothetical protein